MHSEITRRGFLGMSALAATASLKHTQLYRFLATSDAAAKVMAILTVHLELSEADWPLVEDFTASLGGAGRHTEPAAHFQAMALRIQTDEELASYVLQEFFVATNYLAYYKKECPALAMLGPSAAAV